MKNKKIIGSTLSSASLTSGCTDANDETTPVSENCQYYPLPDGTLSIAVGTNKSLESLTIPETHHGKMVTRIADNGFANCTALKQINLPDNINVIGKKAFSGCSSLSSIKIPNASVIGDDAFQGCESLAIYCEAEKQPEGWHYYWNPSDRPVVWGYKSKP